MSHVNVLDAQPNTLALKHSRQLQLMGQISHVIGAGEKVEVILQSTLQHLLHIFTFQAAQIYWLSPSGRDLWLYLERGSGTKPVTQTNDIFSINEDNIISHALRRGQPVYIPNIHDGPYTFLVDGSQTTGTEIKSEVAVPFRYGQGFLGVLRIQSSRLNDFDEVDLDFLSSLTSLLASIIKNTQTVQQLQSDLQEIKTVHNLQLREDLNAQLQLISRKSATGYEYDRAIVAPANYLPPLAQLALAREQAGVSITHSSDDNELVAPIKLYGETIGVIGLEDNLDQREWDPEEISFLEEVSSQVALAIENAHLLHQTQERTQELSLLFEASRQLADTIDLESIYQILTAQLLEYLDANTCMVFLLDPTKTRFEAVISKNRDQTGQIGDYQEPWVHVISDAALLQQLSHSLEPIIQHLEDTGLDSSSYYYMGRRLGVKELYTLVTFPLLVRNRVIGVIEVGHLWQRRNYTKNELQLAQAIVARASVAVENAQLLQQTQQALAETQKLYDISRSLAECTDLDEIFGVVIENVKAYNIDRVSISLVERDSAGTIEGVTIAASWDRESDNILPVGTRITADTFSLVNAFAQPPFHPLISEDLSHPEGQDGRLDEAFRLFMYAGLGAVTLFSAPMFLGTDYKGVLSISTRTLHVYTKEETRIYQTLSDQAIIAIENHRLLAATQQNLRNSQLLSHLSQQLLTADTAEAIYAFCLEAIAVTKPQRGAAIFMYNQFEGNVELELVGLWDNPAQPWPSLSLGTRFSAQDLGLTPLLKTGQTVISNRATEDERFFEMLRQLLTIMQIHSLVAVPIWLSREVGGFILIGNQEREPFSSETILLYEDIARQTSGALENRRLFEQAQYRAALLQTSAEVSQVATSTLELGLLLPQTVELIRDRFGFYHVSIYLVDNYRKYAVIEASTGKIGQQLLNIKHRLEVGGKSVVGSATKSGKPSLATDVAPHAVQFNNPLLPETHSEIALPLIARSRIIGALDVLSTKRGAFGESETAILQSMADQLANAIEAARSYQASQQALEDISKVHEYYLREQWASYLAEQQQATHYRFTADRLFRAVEPGPEDQIKQVINSKQPILQPRFAQPTPAPDTPGFDNAAEASTLVAPLILDEAVIGAIDLELPGGNQVIDEDTLDIIQAVTRQAAQAIESVRQFEQTQAAREEAEALYQVGRVLVATQDESEMLHAVLGSMLSILGLKQGGILFIEENGKFGALHALFENGQPAQPGLRFPIEGNASYEQIISTKHPVVIEDFTTDPRVASVREMNITRGLVSLLLVPIIIDDRVVGALGADSVGYKHVFTEREVNLASAMADQLALLLQNRRLLEDAKQRALQLQTSAEVSQVATSILDQDLILSQAVELIRERFGFYHVQIFLIDEAQQFAKLYKSTGVAGQKLLALNYKVAVGSQSVIGQVTDQRKSIVIRGENLSGSSLLYHRNEFLPETRAELAIPLQVGEVLIGALDVQSSDSKAFSSDEISMLEILAAQLATAIQNARAFAEQQQTAERLKEIDKLKTQFLANMSHELRTPLNSIIGFSRVILKGIDGPLTELQKTDLTSIHNSGQHLLSLINNILDLSKIEAGKMELNFEEIELAPIIKSVVSTALALVKDKPVSLLSDIPDNLPTVWADPTRMRQIILNLVSNACKFTDEGEITIQAQADGDKVTISVSDTGIGIPDDKLETIFEEFTQVDASTTRKVGGTGLGLPISRHFVEMHRGRIQVQSQLGYGSVFSFCIPIKPQEEKAEPPPEPIAADKTEGQRKLVVAIDDDPSVIILYKRYLEQQDYKVIAINPKQNILAQVKELAPSAILLDILMPERDGWSVLNLLKEDPFTKDIPVIVCSIISDKNKGFSLGAADYLVKPIMEQDLVNALKHLENQNRDQIKVLVIDDQADDILLIRRMLGSLPFYQIIEASNGKEGLALVDSINPDLIILDLTMPEMNGFNVVEAIKGNEKTRAIPIIIVSAKELTTAERHFLNGQVEVLLRKGIFTENELLADVSQALKRIHKVETVY
jgi:GAF domain-containing protein/response regulator RpfG family c-di-GMP phosphodiesterase